MGPGAKAHNQYYVNKRCEKHPRFQPEPPSDAGNLAQTL